MTRSQQIDARLAREYGVGGLVPIGTDADLAREFGVTRELIRQRRRGLGIEIDRSQGVRERVRALALAWSTGGGLGGEPRRLRREHLTRIAQLVDCSRDYARQLVREAGILDVAPDPPEHGTPSRYKRYGCRCDDCRDAHNTAQRTYLRRRRAAARQAVAA